MTAVAGRPSRVRGLGTWARRAVRQVVERLLLEPLQAGRLEVAPLPLLTRVGIICGLVALFGILGSLVAGDLWRHGTLVQVASAEGQPPRLIPVGILAPTMIALIVAWSLILAGAVVASTRVRLVITVLFVLSIGPLSRPLGAEEGPLALRIAPDMVRGAYIAIPVILLLFSFPLRRELWTRYATPLAVALVIAASGVLFGAQLWLHIELVQSGGSVFGSRAASSVPSSVDLAFRDLELLLLPLLYVSGIAVAEFALNVASSVITPFRGLSQRITVVALVTLLIVKLILVLYEDPLWWRDAIDLNPFVAIHTAGGLVFFGAVIVLATRIQRSSVHLEGIEERLGYSAALLMFLPSSIAVLLLAAHVTAIYQLDWYGLGDLTDWRSGANLERERLVVWGVALVVGVWLMRYRRTQPRLFEAGLATVVLSAWAFGNDLMFSLGQRGAFSDPLADLILTIAFLGLALARFRVLSPTTALQIAGAALVTWLVATRFGLLETVSDRFGVAGIFVVVFGIAFALFTESAFARGHSPMFPRASRPLLWVGYLLTSTVLLHWLQISGTGDPAQDTADIGLFYFGFPIIVWMIARGHFAREAAPLPPEGPSTPPRTEEIPEVRSS